MMSHVAIARKLRRDHTDAERKLWFRLRERRLRGLKFRQQVSIDRYVVDFCCEAARLIVEIDGGQHDERRTQDAIQTAALEAQGYLVLRFWNNDVLQNISRVLEAIVDTLTPIPSHPDPLPNWEREPASASGE